MSPKDSADAYADTYSSYLSQTLDLRSKRIKSGDLKFDSKEELREDTVNTAAEIFRGLLLQALHEVRSDAMSNKSLEDFAEKWGIDNTDRVPYTSHSGVPKVRLDVEGRCQICNEDRQANFAVESEGKGGRAEICWNCLHPLVGIAVEDIIGNSEELVKIAESGKLEEIRRDENDRLE